MLNAVQGRRLDWGQLAHVQDVRRLAPGMSLGPNMTVVECPCCHKPAIRNGTSRRKDGLHDRYAHELHYYVSKLGRTRLSYETRCVASERLPRCGHPSCRTPFYAAHA